MNKASKCGMFMLAMLSASGAAHASQNFVLANPFSEQHIIHTTASAFIEGLPESAGLNVEYHLGGDLGDWAAIFEQVITGDIPMAMTFSSTNIEPRLAIRMLPYAFSNWDEARNAIGPEGELLELYGEIYSDLGLKLLGIIPVGFNGIAMRSGDQRIPTSFPEDGHGIKMRVPPVSIGIEQFKAFGFSPVPMPYSELYTALQLGTVDGRAYAPPVEVWEMRDVLSSYILTNDNFEQAAWVVNQEWWLGLTEEQREAIEEASVSAINVTWENAQAQSDDYIRRIKDSGVNVVELSEEEQEKATTIAREEVWSWAETEVGEDTMSKMRSYFETH